MKFYIVTPTYNSLTWLQCCIRSVADQVCEGVEVHHHVQDGASSDGTPEWLQEWKAQHSAIPGYTFTYESCPDNGMYDAINKAWEKIPSDADVTAHLNSDEQYLPNALYCVAEQFLKHPKAEVAISTYIVVDSQGRYICHRRPVKPRKWISRTVCEIITCTCFHKVEPFLRHQVRFDSRWRAIADVVFFRDLVNTSPNFLIMPNIITGTFTVTGYNLQWSGTSQNEWLTLMSAEPCWVSIRHAVAYRLSNAIRALRDKLCSTLKVYSIYENNADIRTEIYIKHPTCLWGNRISGEE